MLLLFDCDGTLVDSHQQIITSMQCAFEDVGLVAPSHQAVATIIGMSLDAAIQQLGCQRMAQRQELSTRYRFHFNRDSSALFADVCLVLDQLKDRGYDLGIVTGKSMSGLLSVLDQHALRAYFLVLRTADCCPSKPHPAMVQQSMDEMGVQASDTYVIGDATFDMEMARSAGVQAIGIPTGCHQEQELRHAGATHVVQGLRELLTIFKGEKTYA